MSSGPKPTIFHYHIFKNAGTSFNWSLRQFFKTAFLECDPPTACGILSTQELSDFSQTHPEAIALSSHQALLPPPVLPDRKIISTILIRDPIARVRSIYTFERQQQVRNPGADKAKELNFKEYVEWRLEATPTMLGNYQVHYCSRSLETANGIPGEEQLLIAIDHLEKTSVVGTVERYADWLELTAKILAPFFPGLILKSSQLNVSSKPSAGKSAKIIAELSEELGSSLVQRLLEANQLDMRFYQVADALLSKNLAVNSLSNRLEQTYWSSLRGEASNQPER